MIKIQNKKGVTADVMFATIKSTFTDYVNQELKTNLVFEFTKIDDTVVVKQPAISDKDIYLLVFSGDEVFIHKTDDYEVPLFEEKLIVFVHIVVD